MVRLLGLLDRDFHRLGDLEGTERDCLREQSSHAILAQCRRPDIEEWKEGRLFPKRETTELTYRLTGDWERFFQGVLDYCASVEKAGGDTLRERLSFWHAFALMRCAASSPVAAVLALRSRAGFENGERGARETLLDCLFDGAADALPEDDVEPPVGTEDPELRRAHRAGRVGSPGKPATPSRDPDQARRTVARRRIQPVVFCRYIATAHYLGRHLAGASRTSLSAS